MLNFLRFDLKRIQLASSSFFFFFFFFYFIFFIPIFPTLVVLIDASDLKETG